MPPNRGDFPAFTPAEAITRLSDPEGMQGPQVRQPNHYTTAEKQWTYEQSQDEEQKELSQTDLGDLRSRWMILWLCR